MGNLIRIKETSMITVRVGAHNMHAREPNVGNI